MFVSKQLNNMYEYCLRHHFLVCFRSIRIEFIIKWTKKEYRQNRGQNATILHNCKQWKSKKIGSLLLIFSLTKFFRKMFFDYREIAQNENKHRKRNRKERNANILSQIEIKIDTMHVMPSNEEKNHLQSNGSILKSIFYFAVIVVVIKLHYIYHFVANRLSLNACEKAGTTIETSWQFSGRKMFRSNTQSTNMSTHRHIDNDNSMWEMCADCKQPKQDKRHEETMKRWSQIVIAHAQTTRQRRKWNSYAQQRITNWVDDSRKIKKINEINKL